MFWSVCDTPRANLIKWVNDSLPLVGFLWGYVSHLAQGLALRCCVTIGSNYYSGFPKAVCLSTSSHAWWVHQPISNCIRTNLGEPDSWEVYSSSSLTQPPWNQLSRLVKLSTPGELAAWCPAPNEVSQMTGSFLVASAFPPLPAELYTHLRLVVFVFKSFYINWSLCWVIPLIN